MADAPSIPQSLDDLTPEWLSDALGATVTDVTVTPIGTGQVADSGRLDLTWAEPADRPSSMVAKVTAVDESSRAAAAATRTYELEVGFYGNLADSTKVRAPKCSFAAYDAATTSYAVLLEDVAPAQQGDQLAGCSVDDVAGALDELALLHAPHWGSTTLTEHAFLQPAALTGNAELSMFITMLVPGFLERYGARLSPDVVSLVERLPEKLAGYGVGWDGPKTLVHSDFRADNLMFGAPDGRVVVLDWQTIAIGAGLSDVAYLLGGSLLPEVRAAEETALVTRYLDGLAAEGVAVDFEAAWLDYRRYTFAGLLMAIMASMLVGQTERGDSMFVAMADRAGRHALDLDTESLLG